MRTRPGILALLSLAGLSGGCSTYVQVTHSPLVATMNDPITFTAKAITNPATPTAMTIKLTVEGVVVKTCTSSPCTFVGGPYPAKVNDHVTYSATINTTYVMGGDTYHQDFTDGYYATGITDASYKWNDSPYLEARYRGSLREREDLVFHMASDYTTSGKTFADFIKDVTDKVQNVYGAQELVQTNLHYFNFWVYRKPGAAADCGTVHADADTDMPWRDDDAVLHAADLADCTDPGLAHFSAEGSNTKAFLHESGHAVFGLGDEYNGDTDYSVVQSPENNIFDTESLCRDEQTKKFRDPDQCIEFTPQRGAWFGIQRGTTVMMNGMVGEPWYTEATERIRWYFSSY